jgi:hypothetical protein
MKTQTSIARTKRPKRLAGPLSIACTTSLLLLALPTGVQAQFTYTNNNGTVTITGYTGPGGSVTIPDTIAGFPVTTIGFKAFYQCYALTAVMIPNSVTNLGLWAFGDCTNLTSATIPSSATWILNGAFSSCSRLANVTLPSRLTRIEVDTFAGCTSLTAITIPTNVTSIGESAFGATGLTSVTIPDSVTYLADSVFRYCSGLTNVTIGNGVTGIEWEAFFGCQRLTSVAIGNGVITIGPGAFTGTSLTAVSIPNNVTSIGFQSFWGITSLTNVTVGNSLTNIADQAFSYCSNLRGIYFEGNAPSLGGTGVFAGSSTSIYYLPGTTGWGSIFGGRPTALWPLPTIQTPPQTRTAEVGTAAGFSVKAMSVGDLVLGYQWFFNGTTRLSCTNSMLELAGVQYSQAGDYTVVVTNAAGSVTSAPAFLSVIAPIERRSVPGLILAGQPGSSLNLDFAAALGPAPVWTTFDHVLLTAASQWYFDVSSPLPPQGFYRAWQSSGGMPPALRLNFVPALTLTGAIGSSLRVDYINQFGPIDAWVTLATVTLTNTTQFYYDVTAFRQPTRLYRLVALP